MVQRTSKCRTMKRTITQSDVHIGEWCAVAVPRLAFGSVGKHRFFASSSEYLPCGLVGGKSLMLTAIVVENAFRPSNGR